MAEGNKIYITISSKNEGASTDANQQETSGGQSQVQGQAKTKKAGTENTTDKMVAQLMISQSKKVLSTALSQYGNITGNYVVADRLNIVNTLSMYAISIATTGWVGVVSSAVDIGLNVATSMVNQNKEHEKIQMLKTRSGNASLNGSRYGYDY